MAKIRRCTICNSVSRPPNREPFCIRCGLTYDANKIDCPEFTSDWDEMKLLVIEYTCLEKFNEAKGHLDVLIKHKNRDKEINEKEQHRRLRGK